MKKKKESNLPSAKVPDKRRKRLVVARVKEKGSRNGQSLKKTETAPPKKISRGADEEME